MSHPRMKKLLMLALAGILSSSCFANVESVQNNLKQHYPNLKFEQIQSTEMNGIYSAVLDGQVVYVGEEANHILVGSMIRLKDQQNLTKDLVLKQNSIDWKQLPLQDAIKTVRGSGKRQLAVFSDPNCPYCKKLETELAKLNNVTIYTFIYPIKPQSVKPAKQVWCSDSRTVAWQNLLVKGIQPTANTSCTNPIERNLSLGKSLGLQGTPAIIFSNGFKLMGAYPAEQIEQAWQEFGL
ncbi:DsbC family protein [Acinetobacter radioresistens]|uniref:DsbC family protein n=1 Tax=Acinetobacter radioresistens TaxID=40216 RepID=UPI00061914CB|nr:DsbC family protein [Acinetobacter radioresistens]MCX0333825.1 DsbC family protein [Acinetobacter radioresistens]HAD68641.1 DsbC family protein [Acinetobacter radioresistens]